MFQTEKRKYFKLRMGTFIIAAMKFQQAIGGATSNVPDGKLQVWRSSRITLNGVTSIK